MSKLIDDLSQFLAHRKGLLPLLGCALVLINFILQLVAPGSWLASTDLVLHLGIITAILGLMLVHVL